MKAWFIKYSWLLIIALVIILAVLVQNTKDIFAISKWVFDFLNDWALILSAAIMLLLAIAAFRAISENRAERAEQARRLGLLRIRNWAEETFHALATPSKQQGLPLRIQEEIGKLQSSMVNSMGILGDAKRLGGTLDKRVQNANFLLQKFNSILISEQQIEWFKRQFKVEDDIKPISTVEELHTLIKELMVALGKVINSATEELIPKQ